MALSADVKSAHKIPTLREEDRGYTLFEWQGVLYYYIVISFGAPWSNHWFHRLGGLQHRPPRSLIFARHWGFRFVGDFLLLFLLQVAPLHGALVLALGVAFNIPFSWKKVSRSITPRWIVLILRLPVRCWEIPSDKLDKVLVFLRRVQQSQVMERKVVEAGTGLMNWLSDALPMLRPWAADMYESLLLRNTNFLSIGLEQWGALSQCINDKLVVSTEPAIKSLGSGCRLIDAGGQPLNSRRRPAIPPCDTLAHLAKVSRPKERKSSNHH